jgi:hypothetical protein
MRTALAAGRSGLLQLRRIAACVQHHANIGCGSRFCGGCADAAGGAGNQDHALYSLGWSHWRGEN